MCVLPGHYPRRLLLGLATISVAAFQSPAQGSERESASVLEEIVVTATRREEPLQRTAATVQVLSGAQLESRGAAQFSDYLYDIPNVGYRDAGDGSKQISIRGIANAYGSRYGVATSVATVGMYYNDVPIQGTSRAPDLDLFDIERVEVLKGPQGTLFGEGAMGGAVRVIPVEPKLGISESKIGSLVSSTEEGRLSYRFRGARNVPLSERTALRVVGDYGQDSGYVDNIAVRPVQDDYNSSTHTSARADLLIQPSEDLRLNVFALLDSRSQDGYSRVSSGAGRFSNHDPVDEDSSDRFELVALTAKLSIAIGELSSISSYYRRQWNLTQNYSAAALSLNATIGTFAANPNLPLAVPYLVDQQQSSFAQELRLVSDGDSRFDYVAGLFYRERDQDTDSTAYQPNLGNIINPLLAGVGLPVNVTDDIFSRNPDERWKQLAAYGEASFELSSRLAATAGVRVFREESTFSDELVHLPFLAFLDTRGTRDTEHDGVLPKGTMQYQLDDERMVYVTAAKGFRSGGPNLNFVAGTTPPDFSSDSLWNYEVGLKSRWFDRKLTINAAAFYLDWDDIQVALLSPLGVQYYDNAGKARIEGADLEVYVRPLDAFALGLAVGYSDARFVEGFGTVPAGSTIPSAPEWTASASLEHSFRYSDAVTLRTRLDSQYVGSQLTAPFRSVDLGRPVDSFTIANLSIAFERPEWAVSLFVKNLTNKYAIVDRTPLSGLPEQYTLYRPRTVGVQLLANF